MNALRRAILLTLILGAAACSSPVSPGSVTESERVVPRWEENAVPADSAKRGGGNLMGGN